jgi:glycosyltransferase involved in cell wall biosynthesis
VLVAGSGPDEEAIRSRIAEERLDGYARVLGARSDVPDLMSAADGFVMSSAWEGLPLVLLEAGASSLPIVATDVGGNREAVREGVTGFLVPPGDPEALSRAMRRLQSLDEVERVAMGRAGRKLVEDRYDIDVVARRWAAIYQRLLGDRRTRGRRHEELDGPEVEGGA